MADHVETLNDIRNEYAAYNNAHHQLAALDAAIAALSQPVAECTLGVGDGAGQLFVHGSYDAIKACQSLIERGVAQPVAEAVASGEFSDWFDVWATSKGLTMMKTPDGRFMCPDTSLAEQAHSAGCMTTSIYYMELCRQEEQAKTLASSGLRGTGCKYGTED